MAGEGKYLRWVLLGIMVMWGQGGQQAAWADEPDEIEVPADYLTIQAAINAAGEGDMVVVADGTYTGEGNRDIDFKGKAITVRSENGPENCIIDCQDLGCGFYFHSNENEDAIIEGITIVNGYNNMGAGIYCKDSSPSIINCQLIGNFADGGGGGIYCYGGESKLFNCLISGNKTYVDGGGVVTIAGKMFIVNCTIVGNHSSTDGGGVYCLGSSVVINNSVLWNNNADRRGSEISIHMSWIEYFDPEIPWDLFPSKLDISSSVIQGGKGNIFFEDWQVENNNELVWGADNMVTYPGFVEPGCWKGKTWIEGDYHLLAGSPGIDAGDNSAIAGYDTDLDGNERVVNGTVDIGAYEYQHDYSLPEESLTISIAKLKVEKGKKQGTDSFTAAGNYPICFCVDSPSLAERIADANDVYIHFGPYTQQIGTEKLDRKTENLFIKVKMPAFNLFASKKVRLW